MLFMLTLNRAGVLNHFSLDTRPSQALRFVTFPQVLMPWACSIRARDSGYGVSSPGSGSFNFKFEVSAWESLSRLRAPKGIPFY